MIKFVVILAALSLTANALVIPATDSRIYHTEQNWYADPSGFLETINGGAYIKVGFNGSSFTFNLDDSFDKTTCTLAWSLDGGPEQNQTMPVTSKSITIASGLKKDANHTLYLFVRNHFSVDRWYNTSSRLRIMSVTIDDDATLFAPKLAPKRLMAYWDSIGEGVWINGNLSWEYAHDAHLTFAFSLALALNAELSVVAYGGQGYTRWGAGSSPQLWNSSGLPNESSWNYLSVNRKRTFENCPDYIINGHGTNDFMSDPNMVFTNALGWLRDMRKTCPTSRIFFTVPFGQFMEDTLVKVFQTYQTESSDSLTHLIQMGEQASEGLKNQGPSFVAWDGLHPWAWKSSQLGALLAAKIVPLLKPSYYLEI